MPDGRPMRSKADEYLMGLLGEDGKNFKLNDIKLRYEGSRKTKDDMPILYHKAFRYVRILDGRLVKGRTNHTIIRIGRDYQLAQFQINDNKIEKVRNLG